MVLLPGNRRVAIICKVINYDNEPGGVVDAYDALGRQAVHTNRWGH